MATPPKRLKMDEEIIQTILFLISHVPWKAIVSLPRRLEFTAEEVENALANSNVNAPKLPKGFFKVVRADAHFQVAIFKHILVAGCGTTTSEHHRTLPALQKHHKSVAEITEEPHQLRVGFKFVCGISQTYEVVRGEVNLGELVVPTVTSFDPEPEKERVTTLILGLRSHYGASYKISISSGRNNSQSCQFSGGGDIEIYAASKAAAVVINSAEPEQTEGEEEKKGERYNPPKRGEERFGIIEAKATAQKTVEELTKQLMADMVLVAANKLEGVVGLKTLKELDELNYLVTYGLQVSPLHPLKLLKLVIDFNKGTLSFFELLHISNFTGSGAYIDNYCT